jgi:hypothetical protein
MVYGLVASVFHIIGVIGLHGLFEEQYSEIILWFTYQTAYRLVIVPKVSRVRGAQIFNIQGGNSSHLKDYFVGALNFFFILSFNF